MIIMIISGTIITNIYYFYKSGTSMYLLWKKFIFSIIEPFVREFYTIEAEWNTLK